VIRKHSLFPRCMEPPVIIPMLKSAGGRVAERFDGGFAGAPCLVAADDVGELVGPVSKPSTSVELMEEMVAKQVTSRTKKLVQREKISDMNGIDTGLDEGRVRSYAKRSCMRSSWQSIKWNLSRSIPSFDNFPKRKSAYRERSNV